MNIPEMLRAESLSGGVICARAGLDKFQNATMTQKIKSH
jgi:hypothetical protein